MKTPNGSVSNRELFDGMVSCSSNRPEIVKLFANSMPRSCEVPGIMLFQGRAKLMSYVDNATGGSVILLVLQCAGGRQLSIDISQMPISGIGFGVQIP